MVSGGGKWSVWAVYLGWMTIAEWVAFSPVLPGMWSFYLRDTFCDD